MKRGCVSVPFLRGLGVLCCLFLLAQCTSTSSVHRAPLQEPTRVQAPPLTPQEELEEFNLLLDRG